ncbi:MAG TPA: helix-turn-helix domain-containing protein [Terriglobia bacterium]|nr:helix-turn-helix domain-containing protein [Terriglobia bacterium]
MRRIKCQAKKRERFDTSSKKCETNSSGFRPSPKRRHRPGMAQVSEERLAFSMAEAAKQIGITRRTLEKYAAIRLLKTVKIGRRRLVRIADLERFLSSDKPVAG